MRWLFLLLLIACSTEKNADNVSGDPPDVADNVDASATDSNSTQSNDGTTTDVELPSIPLPLGITDLVSAEAWEVLSPDDDPYWEQDRTITRCSDLQYEVETGVVTPVFSITTSECAWLTAQQTALVDIPKDTPMMVSMWHFAIVTGDAPYKLWVAVGGPTNKIWEKTITVPQIDGDLFTEEFNAPADIKSGDDVYFHLENHGDNEWWLVTVGAKLEGVGPIIN